MAGKDEGNTTIHSLAAFQFANLPEGYVAMMLAYATNQEKLSKREFETFVIGLSREDAKALGDALIKFAATPPTGAAPTTQS